MKTEQKQRILGYAVSNFVGFSIMCISKYVGETEYFLHSSNSPNIILSEFIIIPILIGIISAWFWRKLILSGYLIVGASLINLFIAICLSAVFLHEGIICLIIVSPLLCTFIVIGTYVGKWMFQRKNSKLNFSIFSVLAFIFLIDAYSKHEYENVVSDTMIVKASPAKVWQNVVAFKRIKQPSNFWLFDIGLPRPMETTVDGYFLGAGRKCIFSNGYVFGEKISTFKPEHDLVFDIINQPHDPEIMQHLDLLKGEFVLKDNKDGTTTLIGNSWYRLYVFPAWYYDLWTQSIVRNVHLRVMEHIKQISEK